MLEGHFITLTLDKSTFDNEHPIYLIWYFIKGFTAPMFFTVTGIIFVYLLCKNQNESFFKIARVKKGFKRSGELIVWGYLLQLNIQNYHEYISLNANSWVFAFHVLQCIGVGIFITIFVFAIFKLMRFGSLSAYYLISGTIIFMLYPVLKALPSGVYFPNDTHEIVQNMFKGPYSIFPLIPWTGFILYGGAISGLLVHHKEHLQSKMLAILLILGGISLQLLPSLIMIEIDLNLGTSIAACAGLLARLGQVLVVIGLLMFLEKYFKKSDSLFLRIGQNTLNIYIIHVILLYSGIFGIGINKILKNALTPLESIFGAICFIAFFVFLTNYRPHIKEVWTIIRTAFCNWVRTNL